MSTFFIYLLPISKYYYEPSDYWKWKIRPDMIELKISEENTVTNFLVNMHKGKKWRIGQTV